MIEITHAIQTIKRVKEIEVDIGPQQGKEALLAILGGESIPYVDGFIQDMENRVQGLIERSKPYEVPEAYLYFLRQYGSIWSITDAYYFGLHGIGAKVGDFYECIDCDDVIYLPGKYGFLSLGLLNFRKGVHHFKYVSILLDISGKIQKHGVIGIGPMDGEGLFAILENPDNYKDLWQVVAPSFTEWLYKIAETNCLFGYSVG